MLTVILATETDVLSSPGLTTIASAGGAVLVLGAVAWLRAKRPNLFKKVKSKGSNPQTAPTPVQAETPATSPPQQKSPTLVPLKPDPKPAAPAREKPIAPALAATPTQAAPKQPDFVQSGPRRYPGPSMSGFVDMARSLRNSRE